MCGFKISNAFLASEHVLINLNMFLSIPLKISLKTLEFPRASTSLALVHSTFGFKLVVPFLEVTTGCFHPFITYFHALFHMDFRKANIITF